MSIFNSLSILVLKIIRLELRISNFELWISDLSAVRQDFEFRISNFPAYCLLTNACF